MPTQNCDVAVILRDSEGVQVGSENALGTTEDNGVTVVVPLGYLPSLLTAPLADITRTVIPPPVYLPAPAGVSRLDDVEANTSTLSFS
jgi:hypothetical protein